MLPAHHAGQGTQGFSFSLLANPPVLAWVHDWPSRLTSCCQFLFPSDSLHSCLDHHHHLLSIYFPDSGLALLIHSHPLVERPTENGKLMGPSAACPQAPHCPRGKYGLPSMVCKTFHGPSSSTQLISLSTLP